MIHVTYGVNKFQAVQELSFRFIKAEISDNEIICFENLKLWTFCVFL